MRLIHLHSLEQLYEREAAWDDLWQRSAATVPTVRARTLGAWIERFAPGARLELLVVEDAGRWVAGLPLVEQSWQRWLSVGALPSNPWTHAGDLLLDEQADPRRALDVLVVGLAGLAWPLLRLDAVLVDAPRWRGLVEALARAGIAWHARRHFDVGLVDIPGAAAAPDGALSPRRLRRAERQSRRLQRCCGGPPRLRVVTDAEQVDAALRCGLALEDSGWKGRAGTSVLGTPGMLEFYLRQARQLAAWGHLHLALLGAGERAVAFEYGWIAKGVYHSYKIGYDEQFASCGPGQLLFHRLLASFAAERRVELIDGMGPLDEAMARWATRMQAAGRLVIAPGPRVGRALLRAYRDGWPLLARFRLPRGFRGAAGGIRPGGVVPYRPRPVRLPGA